MIRPLDLADNLSKVPYADRVNQIQRQQPETDQRAFHLHLLERAAEDQSRPKEAEEEEKVRDEGGSAREHQQEGGESEQEQGSAETNPEEEGPLGRHVDVVV